MILIVCLLLVLCIVVGVIGIFSMDEDFTITGIAGSVVTLLIGVFIFLFNPSEVEETIIKKTKEYSLDVQLSQGDIELAKSIKNSGGTTTYVYINRKTSKDGNKPNFLTWPLKRFIIDNNYWTVQK